MARNKSLYLDSCLANDFTVEVGTEGFVRVIDYMGNDDSVVRAARVSYGKGTKTVNEDRGLIRYMLRHRHTSPFEHCEIVFHIKLPIFVARQMVRHRTASISEVSARYSEMEDSFAQIQEWREQSSTNRQGSGKALSQTKQKSFSKGQQRLQELSYKEYAKRLRAGISREQARTDLPLTIYTEWYWKMDLHNLLHFLKLRMDKHAQEEIREYANAMSTFVSNWVPVTWEAFQDYTLNAVTISAQELEILRKGYDASKVDPKEFKKLSNREFLAFRELFNDNA